MISIFFFSSRRRHTRLVSDWSSDVCSSDLWRSAVANIRTDYAFSPRMFATALLQYSSSDSSFSSNLRFRWEYRPGSEFFAVYTEERDTLLAGIDALRNRSFVLKINRLLRF